MPKRILIAVLCLLVALLPAGGAHTATGGSPAAAHHGAGHAHWGLEDAGSEGAEGVPGVEASAICCPVLGAHCGGVMLRDEEPRFGTETHPGVGSRLGLFPMLAGRWPEAEPPPPRS